MVEAVERPTAVRLTLRPHDVDGFCHPGVGCGTGATEVVECSQHVVVPVVRERGVEVGRVDHVPRAAASEQPALEQVLLTAAPRSGDAVGTSARAFECEELERLEGVHGRRPGLAGLPSPVVGREARSAGPEPVGVLSRQQPGTPALVLDARPLGHDVVVRRMQQVLHDLPPDGRVAGEQPGDDARAVRVGPELGGAHEIGPVAASARMRAKCLGADTIGQ